MFDQQQISAAAAADWSLPMWHVREGHGGSGSWESGIFSYLGRRIRWEMHRRIISVVALNQKTQIPHELLYQSKRPAVATTLYMSLVTSEQQGTLRLGNLVEQTDLQDFFDASAFPSYRLPFSLVLPDRSSCLFPSYHLPFSYHCSIALLKILKPSFHWHKFRCEFSAREISYLSPIQKL